MLAIPHAFSKKLGTKKNFDPTRKTLSFATTSKGTPRATSFESFVTMACAQPVQFDFEFFYLSQAKLDIFLI